MNRNFTCRFGKISLAFFLLLCSYVVSAQKNGSKFNVSYTDFPSDRHFYARNAGATELTIKIKGTIDASVVADVRIQMLRDLNNDGDYVDPDEGPFYINLGKEPRTFNEDVTLLVGKINHTIRILGDVSGNNWVVASDRIVTGDAYYIAGQSNAEAKPVTSSDNNLANDEASGNINFVRTFGGGSSSDPKWQNGDGNKNYNEEGNTGQFGMRIGSEIVAKEKVPVCIMNGAELGFPIQYFQKNYPVDPRDKVLKEGNLVNNQNYLTNNYGRELTRLTKAGLIGKIRAIIWYQGESNTYNSPANASKFDPHGSLLTKQGYKDDFNTLYNSWVQDLGNCDKYYLIQIRPGCFTAASDADVLQIQEAQRELENENPKIDIVSTNDFPRYTDNCHYFYTTGYKKIGDRVYNMMDRDLYGGDPVENLFSPKPSVRPGEAPKFTAWDANGYPTQLTLYFQHSEANLSVVGTGVAQKFTLLGGSFPVSSINIENLNLTGTPNNVLRINFTTSSGSIAKPTGLRYESDKNGTNPPSAYIANASGISLISFEIANDNPFNSLPVDPMSLRISSNGGNNTLVWEIENNQDFELFEIERGESSSKLKSINEVAANGASGKGRYQFVDHKPNSVKNFYRIKATKTNGNILYSQVVGVNNNVSTRPGISVYPNPAKDQANVSLTVKKAGNATIQIFDGAGAMVSTRKLALLKGTNMFSVGEVLDHKPGIYMIRVVTEDEVFNTRLVRMR